MQSYVGLVVFSWSLSHYVSFNYFCEEKDLLFWMKISYEIPAKCDHDYRTVGLSKEENKKFWLQENQLNFYWFKLVNNGLSFTCLVCGFC